MSRSIGRRRARMLAPVTVAAVLASSTLPAFAATPQYEPGALELANAALSRTAATQGMVLLENHDGALPISQSGRIAVYGVGSYRTVPTGTGSGGVNSRRAVLPCIGLATHRPSRES